MCVCVCVCVWAKRCCKGSSALCLRSGLSCMCRRRRNSLSIFRRMVVRHFTCILDACLIETEDLRHINESFNGVSQTFDWTGDAHWPQCWAARQLKRLSTPKVKVEVKVVSVFFCALILLVGSQERHVAWNKLQPLFLVASLLEQMEDKNWWEIG